MVEDGVTGAIAGTLEEAVERASALDRDGEARLHEVQLEDLRADMFESWLVPCGTLEAARPAAASPLRCRAEHRHISAIRLSSGCCCLRANQTEEG